MNNHSSCAAQFRLGFCNILITFIVTMAVLPPDAKSLTDPPLSPDSVDLGTAANFAIMAGSGITNTGPTTITGDVGSSPTTSFTGFADVTLLNGANQSLNPGLMTTAREDLSTAYIDASSRTPTITYGNEFDTGVLILPLTPGVYRAPTSFQITGPLVLDGLDLLNPVWIFQIGSTLVTASDSSISMINGAEACHVFWQVGTSATLGTGSGFAGTVMAAESITVNTGATVEGRLLADADLDEEGAVTLDTNTVEAEECEEEVTPPDENGEEGGVPIAQPTSQPAEPDRPSYTTFAQTPNQSRVARSLDQWIDTEDGDIGSVTRALNVLRPEDFPAAFEAIMPGLYAAALAINIELSQSQNQLLFQQMSSRRLGQRSVPAPEPRVEFPRETIDSKSGKSFQGYSKNAPAAKTVLEPEWQDYPMGDSRRWNAWIQGSGFYSEGGMSLVPGESFESGTLMLGLDYRVSKHVTVGLFTSYQEGQGDYDNGARIDLETVRIGATASVDFDGFYASGAAGIGRTEYDFRRPIQWATLDRTARSSTDGTEYFGMLGTGYDFHAGNFTFGPSASLQYTKIELDGFTEDGADSLNLRVRDSEQESLRSFLGGRIAYTQRVNHAITLIPEVRAFWQHEFLQNEQTINSTLDGGNGPEFDYLSEETGKDSFFAGAGLTALVGDRLSFSAFYHSNFASNDSRQQTVSVTAGWRF